MQNSVTAYHIPALLRETIDLLDIKPEGIYVDVTFGGGGHSREILKRLGPNGKLYGFDRDLDARENVPDDPRFTFVHSDFRYISNFMKFYGVERVDGILGDLGVSFHHFDTPHRGFSFRSEAPLDMRMNSNAPLSAKDIVEKISETDLRDLLKRHTDIKNIGAIAKAICISRREKPIITTTDLVETVSPHLNPKSVKKELAQVFQALRIETNDETGALESLLQQSGKLLKRKGRIAILTYHSGEDRVVKDFFKTGTLPGAKRDDNASLIYGASKSPWKLITKAPITASEEEVEANPRSRSAKLRVAELIANQDSKQI